VTLAPRPLPASPVPRALLDGADTLPQALAALAARDPERDCLAIADRRGAEQRVGLGALWQRAGAAQAALQARGVAPGAVVLIVLPTGVELLAAYCGALRAGAVPGLLATPSNRVADTAVYARRIGAIIANARPAAIVCDGAIAAMLPPVPGVTPAVLTAADLAGAAEPAPVAVAADAIATVQYSSGATGAPKGVLLTHRAMLNNLRDMRDAMDLQPHDASVNWVPLYHDMGLMGAFLLPLLCGCPTVLIPTMDFMRDPALWLRAITAYRGALSWAPNFAYSLCATRIGDGDLAGIDLASWRIAITAAEPALAATIDAFCARFAPYGFRPEAMTPAWGLAENVVMATIHAVAAPVQVDLVSRRAVAGENVARPSPPGADASAVVGVGRPLAGCAVEIRDAAGAPLPDRGVGTVWLRSNCLFQGYRDDAARTAQVLVDGWLDTGDRGYLADGALYFVARDKDLLVVGGEKYAPQEIEEVINAVPGVREGCAAVFGVLNEGLGTEDVVGIVETRETDAAALAALRERIRRAVVDATGLALRTVLLVPPGGVEKTTSGKLARSATRARYAEQIFTAETRRRGES
jgi:acyl-CoA synthetase (AMP-forming)/AMP-acid ligase II